MTGTFRLVTSDKRHYLDLLLLADEQESMIDAYLDRGDLWVLETPAGEALAVCVVTDAGGGTFEVANLAVAPAHRRAGLGAQTMRFVADRYRGRGHTLLVATGDSPITVPFYQRCGFVVDHRVPRGIADAYDHPIYENGVQLIDQIWLRLDLGA